MGNWRPSSISLADAHHGFWSKVMTRLCQCTLPFMFLLHCFGAVNLDTMVAQTWQELHSWPALHWAMIEALVAAVSFVGWISWFFLLNEIPSMKGYRMVVREESHPIGTHCMTDRTKHRVWASFPVHLVLQWKEKYDFKYNRLACPTIGEAYSSATPAHCRLYTVNLDP